MNAARRAEAGAAGSGLVRRLAFAFVALAFAATTAPAGRGAALAVSDIGFTVDDLDRSVTFFTSVLGFEKVDEHELAGPEWERQSGVFGSRVRIARLRLGRETLELTDYLTPRGAPYPYDTRANDRWFQHVAIVVSDMDAAYAKLREARVEHASTGPQTLPTSIPAAAGIRAFYFRDPDGHFLELIEFPRGKGDPRWQVDDSLFLGIDHTAIVVEDTERALAFYRDRLGLDVAGASENSGTEQEHLNNVEHARLRITTLKAAAGPGIELLEYLAPRSGRTPGTPPRANDLAFWRTRVDVAAIDSSWTGHAADAGSLGSHDVRTLQLRDPDGHAVELVGRR